MSKFLEWVDARFPLTSLWEEHLAKYYAPKNFNFWYYFGSLALFLLVNQIVTGIFLTMNYVPDTHLAFASVQYIMRDVKWGWLIRYLHVVGASMFFVVIYLHMFRGLLYGSYRKPRELVWIFGMVIFLALMAEAFMGYLLPWGNMSFWGAQVITSLFGAIPIIGHGLQTWIRGSFVVSDATLNRFFALHVIAVPLALAALVVGHIMALHEVGSNNPDGIEIKEKKDANGVPLDGIPFHPYYTVKDIFGVLVFMIIFLGIVFFVPGLFGWFIDRNNYVPANILQTPADVVPLWYFTPFYAILRSMNHSFLGVPAKELGLVAFILSIVLFFFLPWLDRSPVKSIRYRGWMYKTALTLFVVAFLGLGYIGTQPVNPKNLTYGHLFVTLYFAFFVLMPWYTKYDKTKPVPERVTK